MIKTCNTPEDFAFILETSKTRPVLLLKHSTACPISAKANREFEEFAESASGVECWRLPVLDRRDTSSHVSARTGITHQSPQAILFYNGKPVWNASHWNITGESIRTACQEKK